MSIAHASGQTSITGSVTVAATTQLAQPSASQTVKTAYCSAANGAQTIFTTTAGKTAYITSILVTGQLTNQSRSIYFTNDGTQITHNMYVSSVAGSMQYIQINLNTPISVAAAKVFGCVSGGTELGITVFYYEV